MKRICLFVLSLILLVTGCIEFNMKIELNPDGSGTITEEVLFSDKFLQMMESFSKMGGEEANDNFNVFDIEELKSKASDYGEGVELVKAEELSRKNKTGYSAVYSYSDINNLKVEDDPAGKMPDDLPTQSEEEKEPSFTFSFTKGNPSSLIIHMNHDRDVMLEEEDEYEEETSEQEDDMMFQQMKEMLSDMRTSIVLEIDGDIIESNATHTKNNKITLIDLDFGSLLNNPEKLEELKKLKPKGFEEAKKFLKDVPGIKVELNEELKILFR